jgi:hypothetical protein
MYDRPAPQPSKTATQPAAAHSPGASVGFQLADTNAPNARFRFLTTRALLVVGLHDGAYTPQLRRPASLSVSSVERKDKAGVSGTPAGCKSVSGIRDFRDNRKLLFVRSAR